MTKHRKMSFRMRTLNRTQSTASLWIRSLWSGLDRSIHREGGAIVHFSREWTWQWHCYNQQMRLFFTKCINLFWKCTTDTAMTPSKRKYDKSVHNGSYNHFKCPIFVISGPLLEKLPPKIYPEFLHLLKQSTLKNWKEFHRWT